MKVLLDTHALLWFASDDARLGARARGIMADPATERLLSVASAWEMAIKVSISKLKIEGPFADWIEGLRTGAAAELLPIELPDIRRVRELPWHHRDPFDRMLVAQALERGIPIVTVDPEVARYGVEVIW
ncbi:MAG: type II toxin-antitoxin system VapC family toxin [Deltaproteobacteria bacterium]|nr:type II toxin-antitoxin system VapC family toxin [Myxococcales bacterium]MDP3221343.1 type II toxin-antitoxin system VapC family toxin [Deltaproteobacteria bacterium]